MTENDRDRRDEQDVVELSETAGEIRKSAERLERAAERIERKTDSFAGSGYQALSGQDDIPPGKVPEGDDD